MKWLGSQLRECLKRARVSQTALAGQLGVSRQTVVDWTKGQVPKGTHLLGIVDLLGVDVDCLFEEGPSPVQVAPLHRRRRNARVTPEMQQAAHDLAMAYANILSGASFPPLEMLLRPSQEITAEQLGSQMRRLVGLDDCETPIDYSHTFSLLHRLGICVVFRDFPDAVKGYAFYTVVNGQRLVFVNSTTNVLDLIFPVLHETCHAVRNRTPRPTYAQSEEEFCDRVAGLVQFPDTYVDDAYVAIRGRTRGHQVNALKEFARRHGHALYGLVKRIEERHGKLGLDVNGADANLHKEFPTIGDVLLADGVSGYLRMLDRLTPLWNRILADSAENMTTSKLAEILGLSYVDAQEVREALSAKREGETVGRRL